MLSRPIRALFACAAVALVAFSVGAEPNPLSDRGEASRHGPLDVATFGSGCYWCVESDFDKVAGVVETTSGFMGGRTRNPTYDEVADGGTGHVEVVEVKYDPAVVSYQTLLDYYWRHTDVLDGRGQFCDRGPTYRPVIFAHTAEQQRQAEEAKAALDRSGRFPRPIAVEIRPAKRFWSGPEEHQNFYQKRPFRYAFYRQGCGRDARIRRLWGSSQTM